MDEVKAGAARRRCVKGTDMMSYRTTSQATRAAADASAILDHDDPLLR